VYSSEQELSYRVRDDKIQLHVNLTLVDNLEQEEHRLDNRLGRILNDSSNEIYVMDAETLNCLQVNLGATQNLGYSQEEITELGMLDILVNLDRKRFDELIRPLVEGNQDSVSYHGLHRRRDGSLYDVEGRLQLSTEEEPRSWSQRFWTSRRAKSRRVN
jgi:PAS domain S-box-containing protein